MKLTIIGTGYVGLVTGACFAEMGSRVTCVDIDDVKIANLKKGVLPIYEPGLEKLVKENMAEGTLQFTTQLKEAAKDCQVFFIAVGTPPGEDGSADLQYVLAVAKQIGAHMTDYAVIVDKSTVPVGTADQVAGVVRAELDRRGWIWHSMWCPTRNSLKKGRPSRIFSSRTGSSWGELGPGCQNHDPAVCAFFHEPGQNDPDERAGCGDDQVCGQCHAGHQDLFHE